MTPFRVLHVDDEVDIREVVQISLGLDPDFVTRSCASGEEAVAEAAAWMPDLILCDVMMPVMDGPATLSRLRENLATARIPLIFMTARAQKAELTRFKLLGAVGTIAKPFDPIALPQLVRNYVVSGRLAAVTDEFDERLRMDLVILARCCAGLKNDQMSLIIMEELQTCAHKLAGAAGILGYQKLSDAASRLEETVIAMRSGQGQAEIAEAHLNVLVDLINGRRPDVQMTCLGG
jgi:CheY-like chemotaxis protein